MKTRLKINQGNNDNKIIELLGNEFQVKPYYRLYQDFPYKSGTLHLTTDINKQKSFNLIHTKKDNWYGVWYISYLDMYILRKLEFIAHHPEIDIRTAYLYGKKHH